MRMTDKVYVIVENATDFVYRVFVHKLESEDVPAGHTQYHERYCKDFNWLINNIKRDGIEVYSFDSVKV